MRVTVDSLIRLPPGSPDRLVECARQKLTFRNPAYWRKASMGLSLWGTPEELCLLEERSDGWRWAPRGSEVALALKQACPEIRFDDRRVVHPKTKLELTFKLRDYQERMADELARGVQGIAIAPCGAGKTIIGAGVIAKLGQPTMVLVHTNELVDQWTETLTQGLKAPIGVIAAGVKSILPITVASFQTLTRMKPDDLHQLGLAFGLVLIDEAHHIPAKTFSHVLAHLPARYRLGLTATPKRSDGLTPLLGLTVGPTTASVSHETLVEGGYLLAPVIRGVSYCSDAFSDALAPETHADLLRLLVGDPARNELVCSLVAGAVSENRTTLVLSIRKEHCHQLASALKSREIDAEAVTSKVAKKKRSYIMDKFKTGQLQVLCATTLADEGLDIARLETLVIALPSRAEGAATQRMGRLMRPLPGKRTPILYDIIDRHPVAESQWKSRKTAYRKALGKKVQILET
jgi:superfamily II DNA or RNA helicase